jgi:hypothetical protein
MRKTQAQIDDDMMLFSYAGDQPKQQTIHEDLPKPAHQAGLCAGPISVIQ